MTEFQAITEDDILPVIIKYTSRQAMLTSLQTMKLGFVKSLWIAPYSFMNLSMKDIRQLAKSKYVERIELDVPQRILGEVKPDMSLADQPTLRTSKNYINGNTGYTGNGVKVAVLDTGIRSTHPMLINKVIAKYQIESGDLEDGAGHGTWCASCIGGNHITDPYDMEGMAPNAQLINIKVFSDGGSGSTSGFMQGVEKAIELGADIVSYSGGGTDSTPYSSVLEFIDQVATDHNVLCCISAGNSSGFPIGRPSSAKKSISVASISMQDDSKAFYSSTGPTLNYRLIKPDIAAPGGDSSKEGYIIGAYKDTFAAMQGTSMACPHMAGILAQLLEKYGRRLTRDELDTLFANTSVSGKNIYLGWGKLDCSLLFNPKRSIFANSGSGTVNVSYLRHGKFELIKNINSYSCESGSRCYPHILIFKQTGNKMAFFRGNLYRNGSYYGVWISSLPYSPGTKILFAPYDLNMPTGDTTYFTEVLHSECSGDVTDLVTPPAIITDTPFQLIEGIHHKIEYIGCEDTIPFGDSILLGYLVRNVGTQYWPEVYIKEYIDSINYRNVKLMAVKNPKQGYVISLSINSEFAPKGQHQVRLWLYHVENNTNITDDDKTVAVNVI